MDSLMRLRADGLKLGDVFRRFLVIGTAIIGATLMLLPAGSSSSGGRSGGIPKAAISTSAPILRLAADGATVAAVVGSKSTQCGEQTLIWDVRRKTPVVMKGKVDSAETANSCPPYDTDTDLALAVGGGMVGVIRFVSDHYEKSTLSVTRLPTNGRWTDITAVSDYEYGAGEGDYLSVFGDGPVLAFNKWTVCYVYDPSETCPGVSTGGDWWVSDGRLAKVLLPGSMKASQTIGSRASVVGVVALDRGRFLALPPKGNVSIISASNGRITELPIPTNTVRQADLDGHNLLILRRDAPGTVVLDVRDASTGALRNTWPVSKAPIKPDTVDLEDAHAGIAVYRIRTTIYLLQVTDGKSHTIPIPANQGPVHARLEDPGLIYSFTAPGKKPRGRIEFVPFAHLLAQIR